MVQASAVENLILSLSPKQLGGRGFAPEVAVDAL